MQDARGRKGGGRELPHLRGLREERRVGGALPFSPLPPRRQRREWRRRGGGAVRAPRVWREAPRRASPRSGRPSPGGTLPAAAGERGSAAIPGCTAPRPLPSPRPASPRPGPPPCRLREAGTRRRRRLLQSRLSHSLRSPAVAAPSEAERRSCEPVGQPVGGRPGLRAGPTDGRTAEQPDGPSRLKFRHELGHGAVGESGCGAPRRPSAARAPWAPPPPLAPAEGGGSTLLCVQPPAPVGRDGGAAGARPASAPRRAEGSAPDGQRSGPRPLRPPPSPLVAVSPPPSLSGRLARCRAALLCLCISPPGGGGGGPLSRRGAVGRQGGGRPRPAAGAGVPGARASPGPDGAGSLEAPPTAVAPGRGSRAALFGARPPASQAQPTNPLPSPSACARNPRAAVGTPGGPAPLPPWAGAPGTRLAFGICLKLMDRWEASFAKKIKNKLKKERGASQLLYFPFRCSLSSPFSPLCFLSYLPCLGAEGFRQCPASGQVAKVRLDCKGSGNSLRRSFARVEVWRAVISQVQPRDPGRGGAVPRAAWLQPLPFLSHLCTFSVPFVIEGLVKPLQRKGRKNFFSLDGSSWGATEGRLVN